MGIASGNSSLGKIIYTYHEELDPIHLTAVESGPLTFANGNSVNAEGFGLGEKSGLSKDARDVASVTHLAALSCNARKVLPSRTTPP